MVTLTGRARGLKIPCLSEYQATKLDISYCLYDIILYCSIILYYIIYTFLLCCIIIYIYYDILYYTILCTHQSTLFDLVQATYLPLNFSQPKVCFSKAPGKEIPQVWRQLPLCRVGLELTG
jgi:hypothetical protein